MCWGWGVTSAVSSGLVSCWSTAPARGSPSGHTCPGQGTLRRRRLTTSSKWNSVNIIFYIQHLVSGSMLGVLSVILSTWHSALISTPASRTPSTPSSRRTCSSTRTQTCSTWCSSWLTLTPARRASPGRPSVWTMRARWWTTSHARSGLILRESSKYSIHLYFKLLCDAEWLVSWRNIFEIFPVSSYWDWGQGRRWRYSWVS